MGEYIHEMLGGPGSFRFFIQPLLAIVLGLRDGRNDARAGRPPFLFELFTEKKSRRHLASSLLRSLAIPLSVGFVLSLIFQFVIRREVHLLPAFGFGAVFIALPYAVARALGNRVTKSLAQRRRHA